MAGSKTLTESLTKLTEDDLRAVSDEQTVMDYMSKGMTTVEIGKLMRKPPEWVHDVVVEHWRADKMKAKRH